MKIAMLSVAILSLLKFLTLTLVRISTLSWSREVTSSLE
jgi:hypothetical protein